MDAGLELFKNDPSKGRDDSIGSPPSSVQLDLLSAMQ
jgi:hypothetical protein